MNRALIFVIIRILVVDITQTTDTTRRDRAALAFRDGKLINSGISTGRNRIKAWERANIQGWARRGWENGGAKQGKATLRLSFGI